MSNYPADHAAFMIAGGQTVGEFNPQQADRYANHLQEEASETWDAMQAGDWVKAIDGAVDSIVVALGLLHSIGVNPDKAWAAVHAANMRKVIDGKVYRRDDGQVGKPVGWYGPEEELAKLMEEVIA